ncbi:hypothetical protein SAMN06265379_11721 [Saccharicrinis carchari]|uniref:Restriction endonuclease n=2 Tax=Saccharicrinis carchari TaxID=1168039 RepID=A0A521F9Y5_SACCC|nr:hypothetical protein SAMN06265379_11721 [Saccharicrinis carchari]
MEVWFFKLAHDPLFETLGTIKPQEMNSRKIQDEIIKKATEYGLNPNQKGYVSSNSANLIGTVTSWNEIERELDNGQGSELRPDRNGITKFNAIHSSSALCVNNFALLKYSLNEFTFLNYTDFEEASFEKKLPTGISIPNLDFYLENKKVIIGIESKFTEIFTEKLPNKGNNLEKYLNRKELKYLPASFMNVINHYVSNTEKKHLDFAQLIKHTIGLINAGQKCEKKPVLVYIYWLPKNWFEFNMFKKHNDQIDEFKIAISDFIDFVPMSYLDFWNYYGIEETFKETVSEMRRRYELNI